MNAMDDSLGDRMKRHEAVTRHVLPTRTYTVLRIDGKAFHSYTRGLERPFDVKLMDDMDYVAKTLCHEITGTVLAYVQSDEISLLVTDFAKTGTQPWMGGVLAKWQSVSASVATCAMIERRGATPRPLFDARVFTLPDAVEVANYFIWRQKDAVRNSISMTAQAAFSHRNLHGKTGNEMQEMLWQEKGINWNDLPDACKRGRVVWRVFGERSVEYVDKRTGDTQSTVAVRSWWEAGAAPHFVAQPDSWLASRIPLQASLEP